MRAPHNPWLLIIIVAVGAVLLYFYKPTQPVVMPPVGWHVATSTAGATFAYPEKLPTRYMRAVDWPPKVSAQPGDYTCLQAGKSEAVPAGMTKEVTFNDHRYCVTAESEGAAGTIYTNYAYKFETSSGVYIMTFSIAAVQCMNYPDPQQTACLAERSAFDINALVDSMVQTLR